MRFFGFTLESGQERVGLAKESRSPSGSGASPFAAPGPKGARPALLGVLVLVLVLATGLAALGLKALFLSGLASAALAPVAAALGPALAPVAAALGPALAIAPAALGSALAPVAVALISAGLAFFFGARPARALESGAADFPDLSEILKTIDASDVTDPSLTLVLREARKGDRNAQYQLGWAYENGHGVSSSKIKAAKWYMISASGGHKLAELKLKGIFDSEGVTGVLEAVKADRHFEEDLAALKDLPAVIADKVPVIDGKFAREVGFSLKSEELLAAVKIRDAKAMYNLGVVYDRGLIPLDDPLRATRWYLRSAEQGYPGAQNAYGDRLLKGRGGLEANLPEAREWLVKAAGSGSLPAMFHLWELSRLEPRIVSPEEGLDLLKRSAEAGWPDSEYHLSLLFSKGDGVPVDKSAADKLLKRAIRKRHAGAIRERISRRL